MGDETGSREDDKHVDSKREFLRKSVHFESSAAETLLDEIRPTYFDTKYKDTFWRIEKIDFVRNKPLLEKYEQKKMDLQKQDRSAKELEETFVFGMERYRSMDEICRQGQKVGTKRKDILGHSSEGIHLSRHYDIMTRFMAYKQFRDEVYVIVFKTCLGKAKRVSPRLHVDSDIMPSEPYWRYDSHISNRDVHANMPILEAHHCGFAYFYELDPLTKRSLVYPRQLLPYAVLKLTRRQFVHITVPFRAMETTSPSRSWHIQGETRRGFRWTQRDDYSDRRRRKDLHYKSRSGERSPERRKDKEKKSSKTFEKTYKERSPSDERSLGGKCQREKTNSSNHKVGNTVPLSMKPFIQLRRIDQPNERHRLSGAMFNVSRRHSSDREHSPPAYCPSHQSKRTSLPSSPDSGRFSRSPHSIETVVHREEPRNGTSPNSLKKDLSREVTLTEASSPSCHNSYQGSKENLPRCLSTEELTMSNTRLMDDPNKKITNLHKQLNSAAFQKKLSNTEGNTSTDRMCSEQYTGMAHTAERFGCKDGQNGTFSQSVDALNLGGGGVQPVSVNQKISADVCTTNHTPKQLGHNAAFTNATQSKSEQTRLSIGGCGLHSQTSTISQTPTPQTDVSISSSLEHTLPNSADSVVSTNSNLNTVCQTPMVISNRQGSILGGVTSPMTSSISSIQPINVPKLSAPPPAYQPPAVNTTNKTSKPLIDMAAAKRLQLFLQQSILAVVAMKSQSLSKPKHTIEPLHQQSTMGLVSKSPINNGSRYNGTDKEPPVKSPIETLKKGIIRQPPTECGKSVQTCTYAHTDHLYARSDTIHKKTVSQSASQPGDESSVSQPKLELTSQDEDSQDTTIGGVATSPTDKGKAVSSEHQYIYSLESPKDFSSSGLFKNGTGYIPLLSSPTRPGSHNHNQTVEGMPAKDKPNSIPVMSSETEIPNVKSKTTAIQNHSNIVAMLNKETLKTIPHLLSNLPSNQTSRNEKWKGTVSSVDTQCQTQVGQVNQMEQASDAYTETPKIANFSNAADALEGGPIIVSVRSLSAKPTHEIETLLPDKTPGEIENEMSQFCQEMNRNTNTCTVKVRVEALASPASPMYDGISRTEIENSIKTPSDQSVTNSRSHPQETVSANKEMEMTEVENTVQIGRSTVRKEGSTLTKEESPVGMQQDGPKQVTELHHTNALKHDALVYIKHESLADNNEYGKMTDGRSENSVPAKKRSPTNDFSSQTQTFGQNSEPAEGSSVVREDENVSSRIDEIKTERPASPTEDNNALASQRLQLYEHISHGTRLHSETNLEVSNKEENLERTNKEENLERTNKEENLERPKKENNLEKLNKETQEATSFSVEMNIKKPQIAVKETHCPTKQSKRKTPKECRDAVLKTFCDLQAILYTDSKLDIADSKSVERDKEHAFSSNKGKPSNTSNSLTLLEYRSRKGRNLSQSSSDSCHNEETVEHDNNSTTASFSTDRPTKEKVAVEITRSHTASSRIVRRKSSFNHSNNRNDPTTNVSSETSKKSKDRPKTKAVEKPNETKSSSQRNFAEKQSPCISKQHTSTTTHGISSKAARLDKKQSPGISKQPTSTTTYGISSKAARLDKKQSPGISKQPTSPRTHGISSKATRLDKKQSPGISKQPTSPKTHGISSKAARLDKKQYPGISKQPTSTTTHGISSKAARLDNLPKEQESTHQNHTDKGVSEFRIPRKQATSKEEEVASKVSLYHAETTDLGQQRTCAITKPTTGQFNVSTVQRSSQSGHENCNADDKNNSTNRKQNDSSFCKGSASRQESLDIGTRKRKLTSPLKESNVSGEGGKRMRINVSNTTEISQRSSNETTVHDYFRNTTNRRHYEGSNTFSNHKDPRLHQRQEIYEADVQISTTKQSDSQIDPPSMSYNDTTYMTYKEQGPRDEMCQRDERIRSNSTHRDIQLGLTARPMFGSKDMNRNTEGNNGKQFQDQDVNEDRTRRNFMQNTRRFGMSDFWKCKGRSNRPSSRTRMRGINSRFNRFKGNPSAGPNNNTKKEYLAKITSAIQEYTQMFAGSPDDGISIKQQKKTLNKALLHSPQLKNPSKNKRHALNNLLHDVRESIATNSRASTQSNLQSQNTYDPLGAASERSHNLNTSMSESSIIEGLVKTQLEKNFSFIAEKVKSDLTKQIVGSIPGGTDGTHCNNNMQFVQTCDTTIDFQEPHRHITRVEMNRQRFEENGQINFINAHRYSGNRVQDCGNGQAGNGFQCINGHNRNGFQSSNGNRFQSDNDPSDNGFQFANVVSGNGTQGSNGHNANWFKDTNISHRNGLQGVDRPERHELSDDNVSAGNMFQNGNGFQRDTWSTGNKCQGDDVPFKHVRRDRNGFQGFKHSFNSPSNTCRFKRKSESAKGDDCFHHRNKKGMSQYLRHQIDRSLGSSNSSTISRNGFQKRTRFSDRH